MLFKNKLSEVDRAISHAKDYQTYYEASLYHDELSGAKEWKAIDESSEYDFRLIRKRIARIKSALVSKDASGLMYILREGIHGNLGNLANPNLSQQSKIGTKQIIEEFLELVCQSLDLIFEADESEVGFYTKLSFFDETAHAYGESCLMLSGGAGLGFFHAGVVRSLLEHDLIPNVVSGASAGSIIAALIGTRPKDELKEVLSADTIHHYFKGWSRFKGLHKGGFFDSTQLENALIEIFDLTTFDEAHEKTGIEMTVTVSPADLHQISRLLNAKTSPNAIITQAVRASCAIPYVFSPVYLKAKNRHGEVIPYIPHRQFADGSLMADLPFNRLARLYGVNHSIVSQTNPLAAPFLGGSKNKTDSIKDLTFRHLTNMAKKNSIFMFDILEKMSSTNSVKRGIHKVRSIVEQQYVGDINILPKRKLADFKHIFANPSIESLENLIFSAEQATWPQIDLIKRNTKIAKRFKKYLKLLKMKESELLSYCSLKPENNKTMKKGKSVINEN